MSSLALPRQLDDRGVRAAGGEDVRVLGPDRRPLRGEARDEVGEEPLRAGVRKREAVTSPGKRVPATHPIREIKRLADEALRRLDRLFDEMYSSIGRPSIPPERLLKAQLLIALYSVRSERQFCERLDYDLLFRFFLDMNLDDPSWDATTFTKNRDRLVQHEVARQFFEEVVRQAKQAQLISAEHFTVDGTLIEAWASLKSFRKKGEKPQDRPPPDDPGNPTVDFHGEKRSNETPRVDDRPGGEAGAQGCGQGIQAQLLGTRAHGEPERSVRGLPARAGDWPCRARRGARDAATAPTPRLRPAHGGWRQGVLLGRLPAKDR